MAKTLSQIEKQIAVLQRRAEALKKRDVAGVVARIKEAIAYYGLTPQELGFGGTVARKTRGPGKKTGAGKAKVKATKSALPPKFRDAAGNTWSGRGRRPRWYVEARAQGKTDADLAA
jgi:DNA-binding protein H-NS